MHHYTPEQIGRFLSKINIPRDRESERCWLGSGQEDKDGYHMISLILPDGKQVKRKFHRMMYEIVNGVILDPTEYVRHSCDNPPCCNPNHLGIGSAADNSRDMVERGRSKTGSSNGKATLTDEQVREIRQSSDRISTLANKYDVSEATIKRVLKRETYTDVT